MKLYKKTINGYTHILPVNKIVLIENGMQVFNPTEDMLFDFGWVVHTPLTKETSEEEIINMEKEHLIDDIITYDSSNEVNIFYVNDIPIWLDKATRAGLMLRFQAEIAMGLEETTLWYDSFEFKLPLTNAVQILYAVEVYASQCYDKTQYHIAMVKKLKTTDEIKSYDYTVGYPNKLKF